MADPILVARKSTDAELLAAPDEVLRVVGGELATAASAIITYLNLQYVDDGYWQASYTVL